MSDVGTVYALCTPTDGAIRYVGCTRESVIRRLRRHVSRARHDGMTPKDHWVRTLLDQGLRPTIRVLEVVPAEEMFTAERHWVGRLSRHGLLNATRGGRGMAGYSPSTETRAKIRAALVGRALPPETRAKMSASRTGVPRGPFTDEHRANLSAAQRRRFGDPAKRAPSAVTVGDPRHGPESSQRRSTAPRARRAVASDPR